VGALTLSGVGAFVAATEPEGTGSAPAVKPAASKSAEPSSPEGDSKAEPAKSGDGSAIKQVSHMPVEGSTMPAAAEEISHWGPANHPGTKPAAEKTTAPRAPEMLPPVNIVAPPEKSSAAPKSAAPAMPAQPKTITLDGNDPHGMMQKARDLYVANRLDEAEALAQMLTTYPTRWGILEDSPKRLLEDVQKARQRAKDEDANAVLVEARKLFNRGMYDEAERLTRMAERMHGPYRMFDNGDRPQKLLGEIVDARMQASKPRVQPVPAGREATVQDTTVRGGPASTTWQEAPKARSGDGKVVQASAKTEDTAKAGEAVKSADATKAGSAKPEPVTPKTADASKPAGAAKPTETTKLVETPKRVAEAKAEPADSREPKVEIVETPRLVPQPKTVETPKSAEPKVVETPRLVPQPKVVEAPKSVEPKVVETPRLVPQPQPVEVHKVAEPKLIETPKIVVDVKAVEAPKPIAEAKPAEMGKPMEMAKPTASSGGPLPIVQASARIAGPAPSQVVPAIAIVGPPYLPKTGATPASDVVLKQPEGMPDKLPAPVVGQAVTVSAPVAADKAAPAAPPAKPVAAAPVVVPPPPAPCVAPTCCDKGCGHSTCCDKNCGNGHDDGGLCVYGDVGFSIMRPYFKTDPAFFVNTQLGLPPTVGRVIDFGLGTQFVPEINIGVVGCDGLGFRVGWWGFATGDHQTVTSPGTALSATPLGSFSLGNAGNVLEAEAHLNMNVWTFEVTQDWQMGRCAMLVAGGLRYAHIAQRYDEVNLTSPSTSFVDSGHNFDGVGPTLYVRGRRQCGCSGAYLFGDARGSLLVGRFKQAASSFIGVIGTPGPLDLADSSRMVMGEGELELGAGWRRDYSGIDVFLEAGVTGQLWSEVGNSSRSTIGLESVSTVDNNLGLMGITIRAGINY
jgi:hypothetical protein